jgi:hypothetical protein
MGISLPGRFFGTPSMNGLLNEETAYALIRKYTKKTDELMRETL